jgi:hypothetical protein
MVFSLQCGDGRGQDPQSFLLAINNQRLTILGIIPPSESDRFIDYGVKGKIAGYGQLVPYKVSTEEQFQSMHFSLVNLFLTR